jgi:hypothetical protein
MTTIGEFLKLLEAEGEEVFAVGLDREAPLLERDSVAIAAELGIRLEAQHPGREVDRSKLHFLVWLLTPKKQAEKRRLREQVESEGMA